MANVFELNINLNTTGQSEAEKALENTTSGNLEPNKDNESAGLYDALKAVKSNYYVKEVYSNVAKPLMNLQLSTYGTIYGDQARQNRISNMLNTTDMAMSAVSSGITGYAVGGGVGAAIGAILDIVGTVIDGISNVREFNEEQLNHKYDSNYAQERLGILATSKGR